LKKHWSEASPIVRGKIEEARTMATSPEVAWRTMADIAFRYGFDVEPPTTPMSDKLNALRKIGDYRTVNRMHLLSGAHLIEESEKRNVVRFQSMRKWASQPSASEQRDESLAHAAAEAREAEIEMRAQQILAEQNRAATEKARAQARKEIGASK
jgi:hypothetical protein